MSSFGYPDLERVTPDLNDPVCKFIVEKKEIYPILSEMKKVLADLRKDSKDVLNVINLKVTKDGNVIIKYFGKDNDVTFEPKVSDVEIIRTHSRYGQMPEYEVDFNIKLLMKQLRNCSSRENITFRLNGKYRPFTISRENGGLGVVCPVRMQ